MPNTATTITAQFDPKLKIYWYLQPLLILAAMIVGLPLAALWFFIGKAIVNRQFECLSCTLTENKLIVKRGVWFRSQKTIPLENIQDLSVIEGPLLAKFGLCALKVETAGTSVQPGQADAALTGIVDALAFRDEVFIRRDALRTGVSPVRATAARADSNGDTVALLTEIRDSLARIEERLKG